MMIWLDRVIFVALCLLLLVLPVTIGGVGVCVAIAVIVYLVKKIAGLFCKERPEATVPRDVFIPLMAFLGVCAVSIVFSETPLVSGKALVTKILQGVLLACAVTDVVRTRRRFLQLLGCFLTATTVLCLDGLWQLWMGKDVFNHNTLIDGRISSALGHPNNLGGYMIMGVSVSMAVALWQWRQAGRNGPQACFRIRAAAVALAVLVWGVLGLTYSRGAWLAVLTSMVFFVSVQRKYFGIMAMVALVFAAVFIPGMEMSRNVSFVSDDVASVKAGVAQAEFTGQDRLYMWRDALNIIKDHPWTGTGLNTYAAMIKKYAAPQRQMYAHNSYLQMAAELGLIGLGIFLWFLVSVWRFSGPRIVRAVRQTQDPLAFILLGLLGGWLGFLVQNGLDTNFYSVQLSRVFWMSVGILVAGAGLLKKDTA